VIASNRFSISGEGEYAGDRWVVKGGGSVEVVLPVGKMFETTVQEWRGDIYGLMLWRPFSTLSANMGVRQPFVTNLPLAPDPFAGLQWALLSTGRNHVNWRAAFSQSHKIPTLNDRYWGGAHVWLRPERGTTWESGIDYDASANGWNWSFNGTLYFSHVQDWIRWFPAGVVWRPQNIPLVHTSGAEAAVRVKGAFLALHAHYAYTDITVKEGLWEHDPGVGRQLAYQPYHCFSAAIAGNYRFVSLEIQPRYTGARTTNDIHDLLPGYWLWGVQSACSGVWGKHQYTFKITINNLFNKDYQNVKFYAMPGRNYMIHIQYQH
jgi:iron complex outermembrane receptor protein